MSKSQTRSNYYHNKPGENTNVGKVIYKSAVPDTGAGYTARTFFETLGHHRHKVGSPERNAEQEYLLQGMPKGAMKEAADIANAANVGIAVRPTGVLAHMGIESGDPTKAQEFKNKTSKELDLFLCDELDWGQLGAVVHYDPRVGWNSQQRRSRISSYFHHKTTYRKPSPQDWEAKVRHIKTQRMPQLTRQNLQARLRFWPTNAGDWTKLEQLFFDRVKEFEETDYEYRFGHYTAHTHLSGVYIQLAKRKGSNMVGDHDLFGFTTGDSYGTFTHDSLNGLEIVQKALQAAPTFQAQHGGIWNWTPKEMSHQDIKKKIMGAHSSPNGEPLIYIRPGFQVHAAFYVPGEEIVKSAWEFPQAHNWLMSTHSGRQIERQEVETGQAIANLFS